MSKVWAMILLDQTRMINFKSELWVILVSAVLRAVFQDWFGTLSFCSRGK